MTGKDIVLYLINNDLLDVDFANKDTLPMCKSVTEIAEAIHVTEATIKAACDLGILDYVPFQVVENEKLMQYIRKEGSCK